MNWPLFFSTFALIFLAELPDKTAFATLLLASRGKPLPVFTGVATAFLVQSAVAVALGNVIGRLPERAVHIASGILFLVFAFLEWRKSLAEEEEEEAREVGSKDLRGWWHAASGAFLVIFIAEWGDLTQLATATLSARSSSPLTVFLAATSALWSVTIIAISLGRLVSRYLHEKHLQKAAAAVFLALGLWFLWIEVFPAR